MSFVVERAGDYVTPPIANDTIVRTFAQTGTVVSSVDITAPVGQKFSRALFEGHFHNEQCAIAGVIPADVEVVVHVIGSRLTAALAPADLLFDQTLADLTTRDLSTQADYIVLDTLHFRIPTNPVPQAQVEVGAPLQVTHSFDIPIKFNVYATSCLERNFGTLKNIACYFVTDKALRSGAGVNDTTGHVLYGGILRGFVA